MIAGGKSRRFGRNKVHVRWNGENTLLETAVQLAEQIAADFFIVAGYNDHSKQVQAPVYPDLVDNCGPLGGIYTALFYARFKWVAVLPVDMPLMDTSVYRFLYDKRSVNRPVIACSEFGLEPMVSWWPKSASDVLRKQIENGRYSIRDSMKRLNASMIDLASQFSGYKKDYFLNINNEEDLKVLNDRYKRSF